MKRSFWRGWNMGELIGVEGVFYYMDIGHKSGCSVIFV